jgi:hypothetical protein
MLTRNPETRLEALDVEAEFKEVDPALFKQARALAKKLKFLGSPETIVLPTFRIVADAKLMPDRNAVKPWRKLIESWL